MWGLPAGLPPTPENRIPRNGVTVAPVEFGFSCQIRPAQGSIIARGVFGICSSCPVLSIAHDCDDGAFAIALKLASGLPEKSSGFLRTFRVF